MEQSQIAEAITKVQADLPDIGKDKTATVPTKTGGTYSYSYADLSVISKAILPKLAANGLAWTCLPTLLDNGRFVLEYRLTHVSGEVQFGSYPLPDPSGRPQDTGSAITYARRYALCSVIGIVPDEDDDGQGAEQAYERSFQRQQGQPTSGGQRPRGASAAGRQATDGTGDPALDERVNALPQESQEALRQRLVDNNFPNPLPVGALRTVTKWIEEFEQGAPF